MDDRTVEYVVKDNAVATKAAQDVLLTLLPGIRVPKISHSNYDTIQSGKHKGEKARPRSTKLGTIGRTCTFGYGRTYRGWRPFVSNTKWPEVYAALIEYGRHIVPTGFFFNAITLNNGVQAKKHTDSFNVGKSIIVSFGEHTGGKLRVYSTETEYEAMDIKDRPLMFNGALLAHETEPFEGQRWSIIYYCQLPTVRLEGFETTGL
jgi:hypothetical protein